MRHLGLPLVLGLAHGVSDGAAGYLLGTLAHTLGFTEIGLLVLLYNLLAFAAQPVVGLLTDRLRQPRAIALLSLMLMGVALSLSPVQPRLAVALAGLASAAFHVSGGALALCATRGQAAGPGFFAAPGVIGLALGGLLAAGRIEALWPALGLLLLCGAGLAAFNLPALPYTLLSDEPRFERHDWIMLVLLAAIALRSAVWSLVELWVQGNWTAVLLLASAAAVGKLLGGLLADRLGWRRWTVGALLGAAATLTLGGGNLAALMVGVALLQSATPVMLAAVAGQLPRYPATASGLALGLAIAAGGLPLLLGWGNSLGSPPVLSVFAGLTGLMLWLAARPTRERQYV